MVGIQVLQLSAQRRQCGRLSISLPQRVVRLRVNWSAALSAVVFPDSKPRLKERPGDAKFTSDGPSQQLVERLMLFAGEVVGLWRKSVRWTRKSSRTRRTSSQSRHGGGGGSTVGINSGVAANPAPIAGSGGVSLSHSRT